ncbi:MAG TPA: Uma2 family endonuclease [Thermoanaerobaculia bacterium]|nr:Uma2 family endonuclease [Thermoanaerobaculia bacterium]
MAMTSVAAHHWTREEYERVVETGAFEGWKIELVEGVLHDMAPKSTQHTGTVHKILGELRKVSSERPLDVHPQMPLAVSADSLPEPDIAVVPEDPEGDCYSAHHPTTAVLVVEVADLSLQYDREVKAAIYARAAIPEYWIVNLVARQLEIHREPTGDAFRSRSILGPSDQVSPLFAPDVSLPMTRLLPKEPRRGESV